MTKMLPCSSPRKAPCPKLLTSATRAPWVPKKPLVARDCTPFEGKT